MSGNFELQVSVPADEWAYSTRRLIYLEAVLSRLLRDSEQMREWYTTAELYGLALPGMPRSPDGIYKKATSEKWRRRKVRHGSRWYHVFHVSSLPRRSFDALIARIFVLPDIDAVAPLPELEPVTAPKTAMQIARETNTAPPWVLPLMRLMKTETSGDITEAWERLPERLPPGVRLPPVEEAAAVLVTLGLV